MPTDEAGANPKLNTLPTSGLKRIRDEFPPVRMVTRRNGTVAYRVDCRRKGWVGQKCFEFGTRKKALALARKIAEEVQANGLGASGVGVGLGDAKELQELAGRLKEFDKTLEDAGRHFLAYLEEQRHREKSQTMSKLLAEWSLHKQDPSAQLRTRTVKSIQWWAKRLGKEFAKYRVEELTHDELSRYCQSMVDTSGKPASPRYRKQFVGYLGQFFNWCLQRGHCTTNPTARIKVKPVKPDAVYLKLDQCRTLVKVLNRSEFKKVRAPVVVGLFAGIRQAELERLKWSDVNVDQNCIAVSGSNSKIRRGRSVPITPVLKQWLTICDSTTDRVGKAPRRLMEKFRKKLGFVLPQNVLRHTYATYWLSKHRDMATLAHDLGNTEEVASRHYVRMVSTADAEAFWGLYPHSEVVDEFFETTEST